MSVRSGLSGFIQAYSSETAFQSEHIPRGGKGDMRRKQLEKLPQLPFSTVIDALVSELDLSSDSAVTSFMSVPNLINTLAVRQIQLTKHLCAVCSTDGSPYTCPSCEKSYCSVDCYKIHKEKCK